MEIKKICSRWFCHRGAIALIFALTTAMSFKEDVYNLILQKGIVLQGHGMRLTKVELGKPASTGIQSFSNVANRDGAIYNLSGQRVLSPRKGIYIKNGKKFIVK